jgi:neutral trehalase
MPRKKTKVRVKRTVIDKYNDALTELAAAAPTKKRSPGRFYQALFAAKRATWDAMPSILAHNRDLESRLKAAEAECKRLRKIADAADEHIRIGCKGLSRAKLAAELSRLAHAT